MRKPKNLVGRKADMMVWMESIIKKGILVLMNGGYNLEG